MDEVDLPVFAPIPDIGAARLEVVVVRARRDLEEAILTRRPGFQVIGLRLAESHVACAEQDYAIRNLEALEHIFGILHEQRELRARTLGLDELNKLHLV